MQACIEEARLDEVKAPVFILTSLVKLYSTRLEQLGVEQDSRPHSTELQQRILNLKAKKEGRDILLAFIKDIGGNKNVRNNTYMYHLVFFLVYIALFDSYWNEKGG